MPNHILTYYEHCGAHEPLYLKEEYCQFLSKDLYQKTFIKTHRGKKKHIPCFSIEKKSNEINKYQLSTSYFIGVDWIVKEKTALFVAPKLDDHEKETDYIKMLFSSLCHADVSKEIDELFIVKWDQPAIEIEQKQDLLTPFLVVEFLILLKAIVRKGLKKSYYKVEKNLNGRIKGKVLVGRSVKQNLTQNKSLYTYCSFDEFGLNNTENRLLNKALVFVKRYLPTYTQLLNHKDLQDTFNYITPAFQAISDEIELNEIKQSKTNAFYKEYGQALRLAKLILKRFGYNISNTVKDKIQTPPFWIDMSKLFELYTLSLLKDRFNNQVQFQYKHYGNELDYILKSENYKMVIDAKYKLKYRDGHLNEDIRQVSGYSRLRKVYEYLYEDQAYDKVVDCLIIYPDQTNGYDNLFDKKLNANAIPAYYNIFKIGIKLPIIK